MINLFRKGDQFEVWLDTEVSKMDGICIGSGQNQLEALFNASLELQGHLNVVHETMRNQNQSYGIRSLETKKIFFQDWSNP